MRRLFFEILVAPLIWLAGCFAFGFAVAAWEHGHGSAGALQGGLFLGAIGAVGEVAYSIVVRACPYLIIDPTWGRPRLPRWFCVAAWTVVATQIASLAADLQSQRTQSILEGQFLILLLSIVPTIVVAFLASWPIRRREAFDP